MKLIEYTIEGRGVVPMDMLRYDQSWPASSEDAKTITELQSGANPFTHKTQVLLRTNQKDGPTFARWESFGWHVIETHKV